MEKLDSAAFTSTSLKPTFQRKTPQSRKKYYKLVRERQEMAQVTLHTSQGSLTINIWAHLVPQTSENFVELCEEGYYDNCVFHRSIPGFVLQGGDPTGTGEGGKNIFDLPFFNDEFHATLRHSKRGIVSMANSGPNTNKSQFFITYRAVPHLDNKHSVFGEVVAGLETLDKVEKLETNSKNRFKKTEVVILSTTVEKNPFREMKKIAFKTEEEKETDWFEVPKPINVPKVTGNGIGKYLPKKRGNIPSGMYAEYTSKKQKRSSFDFSNW